MKKKKQKKNESKPNQTEPEMLECHCMSASSSMQAPSHRKRERIKREKKEDAKYVHFCWLLFLFLFLFGSHHNSHVFIQLASNQQAEIPHRGTNQRSASFLAMVCTFFASTDDDPFYFRGVRVLSFKHF